MKTTKPLSLLLAACLLIAVVLPAYAAQQGEQISISLTRVFGYSSGFGSQPEVQGTFNLTARGPANLTRVVFFLDGEPMGEAVQDPFRIQFQTNSFPNGVHTLTAVGYTADGRELASNAITANFVPASRGFETVGRIIIPLILVIAAATGISALVTYLGSRNKPPLPAGAPRSYGLMGGTICKKCRRPSAYSLLGINLMVGKLQRCPHCGTWQISHRASEYELRAAEQAELEHEQQASQRLAPELSEEERLRRDIEGTRFND
jgi:ribosomal protein L32